MSNVNHHITPTSADACQNIVHTLLCHRQGGENEQFSRRAIESLVKKLKDKRDELDSLIVAITTGGAQPSKCVTIQRTLDGRLQVAARKGFPHVIYARIWRWPDLHKNEMKHLNLCTFAFDLKCDSVCVNPYHYQRIVSPAVDLSTITLAPARNTERMNIEDDTEIGQPVKHHRPQQPFMNQPTPPPPPPLPPPNLTTALYGMHVKTELTSPKNNQHLPQPNQQSELRNWPMSVLPHVQPANQVLSGVQSFENMPQFDQQRVLFYHEKPRNIDPQLNPLQVQPLPLAQMQNLNLHNNVASMQNNSFSVAENSWEQQQQQQQQQQRSPYSINDAQKTRPISKLPQPEYWCSIAYFELDTQVGETFKTSSKIPTVTIDGYVDPSQGNRFCLGALSNVHRTEASEKSRLHIGRGVDLTLKGEGDVWLRCLSEHSVFVQSYYLDKENGRQPGEAVHKIFPGARIKVFDLCLCHNELKAQTAEAQAAIMAQAAAVSGGFPGVPTVAGGMTKLCISPTTGIGVDDLRRLCIIRLSFVKGWGRDYPRKKIKETPCWIEVHIHRALQLLDEVLNKMPGPESLNQVT